MSIYQATGFPKKYDHRMAKVAVGFLLLLAATVLAAEGSRSDIATQAANQIVEQF